jgi:hypothetical protein
MPITEAVAKQQIARFSEFPGFPETGASLLELVKAFLTCVDDREAEAVGEHLMRTQKDFCPKPAHVYDALDVLRMNAPEPFFEAKRQPGDEPFNGLTDLVDDRVIERLREKAQNGKTHGEAAQ